LRFYYKDGASLGHSPAPSAFVAYSDDDFTRLRESGLVGALVRLKNDFDGENDTQTKEQ